MYATFDHADYHGEASGIYTVQESSLATEHKVWVGFNEQRAHLSVDEARIVRDALTEFIDAHAYYEDEAALDGAMEDAAKAQQALKDITFLWDWRVNQGYPFLRFTEDVPTMRSILAKVPIEKIPGFEWVAQARAEEAEEQHD